jgi:hypothetical protein
LVRRNSIQVFNSVFKAILSRLFFGRMKSNNPVMKKVNLNKTLHFTATNLSNIEHTKKIFIIFGMMADWAEFYNKSFFLWVCYLLKCTVLNCFIPSTAFINQNLE